MPHVRETLFPVRSYGPVHVHTDFVITPRNGISTRSHLCVPQFKEARDTCQCRALFDLNAGLYESLCRAELKIPAGHRSWRRMVRESAMRRLLFGDELLCRFARGQLGSTRV